MNRSLIKIGTAALAVALAAPLGVWPSGVFPAGERQTASAASARQMEFLNRGLVAVKVSNGVFLSWRLLGTESMNTTFHVYRNGTRITSSPVADSTNFLDTQGTAGSTYYVRPVVGGVEQAPSETVGVWSTNYLTIPLQRPAGGTTPDGVSYTYSPNDASAGDLDGDGRYEIVLKWDPSNSKDNSQSGYTGNVYVDAYKLDGTRLWRIDLGRNIRAGAHYTQFLVYDFDGDGRAEVVMKTADGTRDGTGAVIGNPNADYRNSSGYILSGPEYLTVFDGLTGRALATTNYEPPRGNVCDWGDCYGNRVDRFLAAVAYLDGVRPSFVMARGYYTRTVLVAYNWRGGQLTKLWTFDTNTSGNSAYAGQGNHNLSVADVDGDGKDEIIYGSMAVDDNGGRLYTTGLGHGDAMHLGDLNPNRPGLEVFQVHESTSAAYGFEVHDARTGQILWGINTGVDTGRGMAADIDPRYAGDEVWASAEPGGVYSITGQRISTSRPSSINFGIWWDGDLSRELLDHNWDGSVGVGKIDKWDYNNNRLVNLLTATGTYSNNGTKGNPVLQADLLGDWREEVIWRTSDNTALRLYTTTAVTNTKIYTLMHDPVYRLGVAWQNVGYNQPPHTGFFLGNGMATPPVPNIYVVGGSGGGGGGSPDIYQAESGTYGGGVTIDSNNAGFNGTGFANFPASGGYLQWSNVDGNGGGAKTIRFRYALGVSTARTGRLIVNGAAQDITFQPTGSWTTWQTKGEGAVLPLLHQPGLPFSASRSYSTTPSRRIRSSNRGSVADIFDRSTRSNLKMPTASSTSAQNAAGTPPSASTARSMSDRSRWVPRAREPNKISFRTEGCLRHASTRFRSRSSRSPNRVCMVSRPLRKRVALSFWKKLL